MWRLVKSDQNGDRVAKNSKSCHICSIRPKRTYSKNNKTGLQPVSKTCGTNSWVLSKSFKCKKVFKKCFKIYWRLIQWGSEIQPIEIQKYLRSRLFEGQISNSWTLATVWAIVPTIQKLDHCPDFKWLAFRISAC